MRCKGEEKKQKGKTVVWYDDEKSVVCDEARGRHLPGHYCALFYHVAHRTE